MLLGLETTLLRLTALSEFGVLIYQKSIAEDWNKLWGQDEEGDVIRMLCGLELVSHRLCCPPAEIFLTLVAIGPTTETMGVGNVVIENNLRTAKLMFSI